MLSRMYGVPDDLPIQPFVGQDLNQICLGRFQIQLHFSGAGSISVEGRWEIRDAAGNLLDSAEPHESRESYRIHRLIDVPVARLARRRRARRDARSSTLGAGEGHRPLPAAGGFLPGAERPG